MLQISKPFIIPLFIPHEGCPNQCIFCDQSAITGKTRRMPSPEELRLEISSYLKYKGPGRHPVQISFYGGTFLGLENRRIRDLLALATDFVEQGLVDSIRFSTRPDSVDEQRLDIIAPFPVKTVELGVQSMDDQVLGLSRRGHGSEHTKAAAALLARRGYETGFQVMVGLPGDTLAKSLVTAERLARLKPAFIRIYPVLVLVGSSLAGLFERGAFSPLDLSQAVAHVKQLYLFYRKNNIPVIRMGLQASEELDSGAVVMAGPYHPSFGHLVLSDIFLDMATMILQMEYKQTRLSPVNFYVHSKNISRIRGLKNNNLDVLKTKFNLDAIGIFADDSLDIETVKTKNTRLTILDLCQA